jgi:type II secretory pathway component PulC
MGCFWRRGEYGRAVEVNGKTLDGLPTVMRLFGQAQTTGQVKVTVLRGGQKMTFVLTTK